MSKSIQIKAGTTRQISLICVYHVMLTVGTDLIVPRREVVEMAV